MGKRGKRMKMSFGAVLTIVFVALKLCHVIAWSWVWVLSPLWIGFLLWVVAVIILSIWVKK